MMADLLYVKPVPLYLASIYFQPIILLQAAATSSLFFSTSPSLHLPAICSNLKHLVNIFCSETSVVIPS